MAKLYVIRTGQTTFEAESRVESAAGAPLSEQGILDVQSASQELVDKSVNAVYASPGEAESQTAKLVGKQLGVKIRTDASLREIDYGMWQGLTVEEIQRRQPKVYRQWTEAPTTVCPPGGETIEEVQERICRAVGAIFKKHKNAIPLVVLRPVALGLLRCTLENKIPETLWEQTDADFAWFTYEMDETSL